MDKMLPKILPSFTPLKDPPSVKTYRELVADDKERFENIANVNKDISNADIRRLTKRADIACIYNSVYAPTREIMSCLLRQVVKDSVLVAKYCRRKYIVISDVEWALERYDLPVSTK